MIRNASLENCAAGRYFGEEVSQLHVKLSEIEVRLGTPREQRCDVVTAQRLAHELRGKLMAFLLLEEIKFRDGHAA